MPATVDWEDPIIVSVTRAVAIIPIRPGNSAATLTIAGRTVLDGTIRALRAVSMIGSIVLALENVDQAVCLSAIDRPEDLDLVLTETRESRWLAIEAALDLAEGADIVLLHEPDRPLVSSAGITDMLRRSGEFDAWLTAMPVNGTIKRVVDRRAVETIRRETLRSTQTPWVFGREQLARAVRRAISEGLPADDELQLAHSAGIPVHLAEGHRFNVPIASPADARFAEIAVGRHPLALAGVPVAQG